MTIRAPASLPPSRRCHREESRCPCPAAQFFVGLDWATDSHAVCVIDTEGRPLARFSVEHSADGIALLIRRLAKFGDPLDLPVGIERPDGRLVDLLLEAGHPVVPVSPNAIKTWREGEVLSGAKSDAADAAVIAEYLRLRQHRLTAATPYSGETKAVRTVVRTRDDLVAMRVAAVNQLAGLLDAHWPGAKAIFADLESPIALAFLTRYPTPTAAMHLGEKRIAGFCKAHGYSGRRSGPELLTRLRSAPSGTTDPHLTTAVKDAVLAMVGVIGAVNAAIKTLDASVAARLGEHPDGEIFTSLPRSVRSTPPRCSPSGATAGKPMKVPTPSPPLPAARRSPRRPVATSRCTSAGPATSASAGR